MGREMKGETVRGTWARRGCASVGGGGMLVSVWSWRWVGWGDGGVGVWALTAVVHLDQDHGSLVSARLGE